MLGWTILKLRDTVIWLVQFQFKHFASGALDVRNPMFIRSVLAYWHKNTFIVDVFKTKQPCNSYFRGNMPFWNACSHRGVMYGGVDCFPVFDHRYNILEV